MGKHNHNPWLIDFFIDRFLFTIRWHIPNYILKNLFHYSESKAGQVSRKLNKLLFFWLDYILKKTIHKERSCVRKLKYLGCHWCPELNEDDHQFFKIGRIYTSETFNGATYTIKNYGKRIGSAYFEIADL